MLFYAAIYIAVFALYAIFWQKRESEFVREKLVEKFYTLAETEPKSEEVQFGGVVYVLKNMDSPTGRAARGEFRRTHMSELIIAGLLLVATPIGIVAAMMQGLV